jgi:hypothetical protein
MLELVMLFTLVVSLSLALIVAAPAIWPSDPARRENARWVLTMILTAFGRRPVS